jgi:O-antigen/teichoic acid export membrane protein
MERGGILENSIVKKGMLNIKYVLISQLIFYALGFLTAFVLPGILGVTANGYYQIYLLYTTYVGILHLGFNDGIYLKFGSYEYNELPQEMFRSFMRFYLMFTSVEIIFFSALLFLEHDKNVQFAIFFAILNILVVNASKMFNNINQITGRIKIFSFTVVAGNVEIIAAVLVLLLVHGINFRTVIVCDFGAKLVVLIINIICDRQIVFGKTMPFRIALSDCFDNFSVGIKLTIANFMGMLIIDIGRFIMSFGKIENFSLYSFAVNSITIAMMFISAVSLVLYPILCRLERASLPNYFAFINRMLCAVIFFMMLSYYPLVLAIKAFLPKYAPVLEYLYLLFPIVIMQSKMQLLINTYYNSLREEKSMMYANISSLVVFLVLAVPLFSIYHSIDIIVWATLITFAWRCYASELYLKRRMGIKGNKNIVEEIVMAVVFILAAGVVRGLYGMLIYATFVAAYLVINRKEIGMYSRKLITAMIK